MTTIQFRRRLIVVLLLCAAAVAAVVRHFAAPGSTVHDVSTVMMLLWLPVIGSIVGWCYGKLRRPPPPDRPPAFAAGRSFEPHALVECTLRPAPVPAQDVPLPPGEHQCVFVVGNQGFLARWQVAPGETVRRGQTHRLHVEYLTPAMALPQLPRDTAFRMLVGDAFIGDGRVLELLPAPG